MPETTAGLKTACSGLFSPPGIEEAQNLDLDPILPCAQAAGPEASASDRQAGRGEAEHTAAGADARCFSLHPEAESEQFQPLGPDPIPPRARVREREPAEGAPRDEARDKNGRFAKGRSGNPRGRPPGIPNPRRRPLGLLLRQARPGSLPELIERKPQLRLPILNLVMGPPARWPDPGDRLGLDFSRMRSAPEIADGLKRVLDAVCRGEISPGEGAVLTRRARKPLRAIRRLMWREIALLKAQLRARAAESSFSPAQPPLAGRASGQPPARAGIPGIG